MLNHLLSNHDQIHVCILIVQYQEELLYFQIFSSIIEMAPYSLVIVIKTN